jgi:hypothetical protein
MNARTIANQLSKQQRNCLMRHFENPQPVKRGPEFATAQSLMYRNLLRGDTENCPRFTSMTELGHEVHCYVLGDCAEELISAAKAIEARLYAAAAHIEFESSPPVQPSPLLRRDLLIERILSTLAAAKKSDVSRPLLAES